MPAANTDSHEVTTRLHVDELILDYLLWFCTSSLLKERRLRLDDQVGKREWTDAAKSADMGMRLVNSFTQTFKRIHPNAILPDSIALRQRICRFTTVLLRRLDATSPTFTRPSHSSARTRAWLARKRASNVIEDLTSSSSPSSNVPVASEFSQTPFAPSNLHRNTEEMHRQMGFSSLPAAQQMYWGNISLREGLKEFMVLSSWTCAFNDEVSTLWMETATNYMVQSVLEAYRCEGAKGIDALNECFSWGPTTSQGGLDDDEIIVNEMFGGDDGSVGVLFEEMKTEALLEVLPPDDTPLETHLDRLAEKHTWAVFEETLVSGYLTAVVSAQPSPVLLQLESGKLNGFEDRDISTLLANAGALVR